MQHRFRGIAQLVEQRSPKPRAVSSRLTTPAITAQVLRSLCGLFFWGNSPSLAALDSPLWDGAFGMAAKSSAKVRSLRVRQRLPPRGSWQNRQVLTEGVQPPWVHRLRKSAFFIFFAAFLFFPLDKPPIFRYNSARSGGKRRTNLSDHGPVAQLVRAPACHAGGRRFEPDPGRHLLL